MQTVNANGVPVVITTQAVGFTPDKRLPYANMKNNLSEKLITFGCLQIVFGVLCIILEAASVAIFATYLYPSLAFIGYGFWIGILFIVTGVFGFVGGRQRSRCHVISFNVLSIISASFAALLLGLAIPSAIYYSYASYYYRNYSYSKGPVNRDAQNGGIAMESLMAILALAEGIVAIWSSVVCCKIGACCCDCDGQCCCPPSANANQVDMRGHPYAGQSPVGQQQFVMYNGYNQNQPVTIAYQQPTF